MARTRKEKQTASASDVYAGRYANRQGIKQWYLAERERRVVKEAV